jgi:hypothetical protein
VAVGGGGSSAGPRISARSTLGDGDDFVLHGKQRPARADAEAAPAQLPSAQLVTGRSPTSVRRKTPKLASPSYT